MTDYDYLIDQLREYEAKDCCSQRTAAADAIEALVKARDEALAECEEQARLLGMSGSREAALVARNAEVERDLAALRKQIDELQPNADRYELMRDMKLYEMQQYRCLPVPMEEAYDWFDAQIDAKIRERYPNAEIGE